jgi:hypothetical protein
MFVCRCLLAFFACSHAIVIANMYFSTAGRICILSGHGEDCVVSMPCICKRRRYPLSRLSSERHFREDRCDGNGELSVGFPRQLSLISGAHITRFRLLVVGKQIAGSLPEVYKQCK